MKFINTLTKKKKRKKQTLSKERDVIHLFASLVLLFILFNSVSLFFFSMFFISSIFFILYFFLPSHINLFPISFPLFFPSAFFLKSCPLRSLCFLQLSSFTTAVCPPLGSSLIPVLQHRSH